MDLFQTRLSIWREKCNAILAKVENELGIVNKRADLQRDNIQGLIRKCDWLKHQIDKTGSLEYNNDIRTELENLSRRITELESRHDRRLDVHADRLELQSRKIQALLDYCNLTYNQGTNVVEPTPKIRKKKI